jgi:hypothetical protein
LNSPLRDSLAVADFLFADELIHTSMSYIELHNQMRLIRIENRKTDLFFSGLRIAQ